MSNGFALRGLFGTFFVLVFRIFFVFMTIANFSLLKRCKMNEKLKPKLQLELQRQSE